jgi:replicative superfamily II helicase
VEWQGRYKYVVNIPTPAGKTTVMEVARAETLAGTPGRKAILVFPYVAIAAEKLHRLAPLFPANSVPPFYGVSYQL